MENNEVKSWLEVSMTVDNEIAEAVAEVLSRFAENDFPDPGVPKMRPLGFLSFFRSAMIMLLDMAFNP